jgi:hypothetical protein
MLRSVKEIVGYTLAATDGEIGRCKDFLVDDTHWTIRYMVADTSRWLPGRKVLISPISFDAPDWESRLFPVRLSKEQIKEAPNLDEDAPVSRQYEVKYYSYYGWPHYWGGAGVWGLGHHPHLLFVEKREGQETKDEDSGDPHLRSVNEIKGYNIQATDDEIGHVEDFIVDDETWTIRYLVVDTRNWLPGKKVLVSPLWLGEVDFSNRTVKVELTRTEVQNSPEYNPGTPVNREYEERLYDFYGRPRYWA